MYVFYSMVRFCNDDINAMSCLSRYRFELFSWMSTLLFAHPYLVLNYLVVGWKFTIYREIVNENITVF